MPAAYIAHRARGRLRVRIREKKGDTECFAALRRQLLSVSGVSGVRINESVGSVLITHSQLSDDDLASVLDKHGIQLEDGPEPGRHALAPLLSGIKTIDRSLAAHTAGVIDLRVLVFLVALLIAIRQMWRGNLFSPALPLLWSAVELASKLGDAGTGQGESD